MSKIVSKTDLFLGIDDIGTETGECIGWTYFVLPQNGYRWFAQQVSRTLAHAPGLKHFHGKKYKTHYRTAYERFLQVIAEGTNKCLQVRSVNRLYAKHFFSGFIKDIEAISKDALAIAGVADTELIKAMCLASAPIIASLPLLQELGPDLHVIIEMDSDKHLEKLIRKHQHGTLSAEQLLSILVNSYRNQKFRRSPVVDEVRVTKDTRSYMIQAADVVGHFSMNAIFHEIGTASKSKLEKSEVIRSAWGPQFNLPPDLKQEIVLRNNDLVLVNGAAYTFSFGAVIKNWGKFGKPAEIVEDDLNV